MKILLHRGLLNSLLLIALIILTACTILGYRQIHKLLEANKWVIHTYRVLETSNNALLALTDADNAISDFLVSNESELIADFPAKINAVQKNMLFLHQLTKDNSSQQIRVIQLQDLVTEKIRILETFVNSHHKGDDLKILSGKEMSELSKKIAAGFLNINNIEFTLLSHRNQASQIESRRGSVVFLIASGVSELTLLLCFILFNYYLSQRNLAEQKKSEKEQQLRLVTDATKDYAILMLNPNGVIETWNLGAQRIFGYKTENIVGKNFSSFYSEEDLTNHPTEPKLEIARTKGRYEEENWQFRKDGSRFLANVIITAIRDEQQHLIGFGEILRDLTEQNKITQMKNEFVSVVSHELRTPLTSIRGSLALMTNGAAGEFSDTAKKLLDIANSNCERLLLLINDILDIEKLEAGKMNFEFTICSLNELAEEAVKINKIYAEKHNVQIRLNKAESDIHVSVDCARLTQVFTNLISNAAKFSRPNEIIDITIQPLGDQVRIAFANKGPGIPLQFQNQIFNNFSQGDSTSSRAQGGTGLGLSISKAIIEKLHGKIHFTSIPDKETVFYIDLPIA